MSKLWAAVALAAAVVVGAGLQSFVANNQAIGQGVGNFNFVGNVTGTNTYTAVAQPNYTGNQPFNRFCGYFLNANTAGATLNLSGRGAVPIADADGNVPLAADAIRAGGFSCMQLNPAASEWVLEARGGGPSTTTGMNTWVSSNVWQAWQRNTLNTSIGISSYCGRPIHYNNTANGTINLISTEAPPGCAVVIVQENTGQATVTATPPNTVVGSTSSGCAATPRTKERWSTIWAEVVSSSPTTGVVNVSGDCG